MKADKTPLRLGVALGSGAARGWAHIGVLKALSKHGFEPHVVCGTSIGALVGGIYAAGKLAAFEDWVVQLTRREVFSLLDFTASRGGTLAGKRLMDLGREHLGDVAIGDLSRRYAAVATDLDTGSEVWLQEGSLFTAIRASISLPGVFTPVRVHGHWLVDGGLVNPVPVSLCRALGADLVVAVDLSQGRLNRTSRLPDAEVQPAVVRERKGWWDLFWSEAASESARTVQAEAPGLDGVVNASLNIMMDRISRSRLAGDPPDLLLTPRVNHVPSLEFTGGQPSIEEGYDAVERSLEALNHLIGLVRPL